MSFIPAVKDYFVMLYDAQISKEVISHSQNLAVTMKDNDGLTWVDLKTIMQYSPGYLFYSMISSMKSLFFFFLVFNGSHIFQI